MHQRRPAHALWCARAQRGMRGEAPPRPLGEGSAARGGRRFVLLARDMRCNVHCLRVKLRTYVLLACDITMFCQFRPRIVAPHARGDARDAVARGGGGGGLGGGRGL